MITQISTKSNRLKPLTYPGKGFQGCVHGIRACGYAHTRMDIRLWYYKHVFYM
nr:MAG TPA: hypothetical protein [Caudoviricetes sp.]